MGRLDGRRILVVGVGPGLGSATVYLLMKDGAQIVMASRTRERLEEVKGQLSVYGRLDYVAGDASSIEGAATLVNEANKRLGGIDGLVLLAGNYADTPISTLSKEGMDSMIDTNIRAPLYTLRHALPYMGDGSSVVMVSSVLGTYASSSGNVAYSAAKAGIAKATEVLANELVGRRIRVNAVAPRSMRHDFSPERDWRGLRKLGDADCPPEDVASAIVWLMTDESSWIDGAVIPLDGGKKK